MIPKFLPNTLWATMLLVLPVLGTSLDVKTGGTKTFYLDSRAGYNQITVISESTLEDFTIIVNKLSGECAFDPANLESFKGRISFKVKDVNTGIALRDEHMLTRWLDAAKYPDVVVTVNKVEDVEKVSGSVTKMMMVGALSMHGVTRDVRVPVTLTYISESPRVKTKGDLIRIRGAFDIKLSDFKVTGPPGSSFIEGQGDALRRGIAVANVLQIRLSVFGASEPPSPETEANAASSQPTGGLGAAPRRPGT